MNVDLSISLTASPLRDRAAHCPLRIPPTVILESPDSDLCRVLPSKPEPLTGIRQLAVGLALAPRVIVSSTAGRAPIN